MMLEDKTTIARRNIINFLSILNDFISKEIHPIQIYGENKIDIP